MKGSQFLVRVKKDKLAVGLFFTNDPEKLADMIDEFCSYDGLEYRILDYPINLFMTDFNIPLKEENLAEKEEEERAIEISTVGVNESYWDIISDPAEDDWHDVPTNNTFISRLYNKRSDK